VLDALRNLQQPQPSPTSPGGKITPRLAASIRRAVLGAQAEKSTITAADAESLLLFRVPDVAPPVQARTQAAPSVATLAPPIGQPLAELPASTNPAQDSLSLVDAIAASLREVVHEEAAPGVAQPDSSPSADAAWQPLGRSRSEPTASELEIFNILADVRSSSPYRNLLQAVKRDTQAIAAPVVALIGLDDHDSTAFVTACLGALFSEEEGRRVLLVEAHGTNHRLASLYGVPHAVGLCEHLAGRLERGQAVVPTSQRELSVLPFGQPHAPQLPQLVGGLEGRLHSLRGEYGLVLVDAGPLATPWALAASRSADVTYLLVRLGEALAESAVAEVNRFRAAGGKVSGCIAIDPAEGRR
jgi:Mrp family chromosome partitioning ATPase